MKKLLIFSGLVILFTLLVSPSPNQSQQWNYPQVGRYQLYQATIRTPWEGFNVHGEFITGDSETQRLLKIDTMTGEVYRYDDGFMFVSPDSIFHDASSWVPLLKKATFKMIGRDTSSTK